MILSRRRINDFLDLNLKRAAKALYQPPLIELARRWRPWLAHTRFIGVTGSAGKTTTKDLLHAALARRYRTVKSEDSNNQLYNVARTLLSVRPRTQFCVQEVGLNRPGVIREMAELLRPHVGIITIIGTDHLSHFLSREAIAAEKGWLIERLEPSGIAVLNADDPLVAAMARRTAASIVTFGFRADADFRGEVLDTRYPARLALEVRHRGVATRIDSRLYGKHHAVSALAAFAAAVSVGADAEDAAAGIGACEPMLGRLSLHPTQSGVTFIRDDFKAPAWSLGAALKFMAEAEANRKIVVLGTLSDRSESSRRVYRDAATAALEAADQVVIVGDSAPERARRLQDTGPGRLHGFTTVREAAEWLRSFAKAGDLVLLKGSLADHLARIPLSFDREVGCWRSRCGRGVFCDHCRLITHPANP
jgi:UDP-N-acetylmuramoyl-tripeptide--D-alanyl-D-alanine ligase